MTTAKTDANAAIEIVVLTDTFLFILNFTPLTFKIRQTSMKKSIKVKYHQYNNTSFKISKPLNNKKILFDKANYALSNRKELL